MTGWKTVHRKGSNVKFGYYYFDYDHRNLLGHYGGKTRLDIDNLRKEYEAVKKMTVKEATKDSPLTIGRFTKNTLPQKYYSLKSSVYASSGMRNGKKISEEEQVKNIISALDNKNRWLTKHRSTSNPYTGDGTKKELSDEYASTNVGDETDTSPYRDEGDRDYIATGTFITNMQILLNYVSRVDADN